MLRLLARVTASFLRGNCNEKQSQFFIKLVICQPQHSGFVILCLCGVGSTVLHIFNDTPLIIVHIPKRKSYGNEILH